VTTLFSAQATTRDLAALVQGAPLGDTLTIDHRRSIGRRFREVPTLEHRRLDAWLVEQGGRHDDGFVWSPPVARRVIGNAAAERVHNSGGTIADAVRDEIAEHLVRATSGRTRRGSLSWWLAGCAHPVLGVVLAEATTWATQLLDFSPAFGAHWNVTTTDAYYDLAGARTSLRGRRDIVINAADRTVIVRVRSGAPGRSAGAGLRADLLVNALADASGVAAGRCIGLWPDANIALAVDGSLENLRAGGRDLLRSAVALRREALTTAA